MSVDPSKIEKIIRDSVSTLLDTALDERLKPRFTENTTVSLWMSPEARQVLKTRLLNLIIALMEYRGSMEVAAAQYEKSDSDFLQDMAAQLRAGCRTLETREKEYSDLLEVILDFDSLQDPDLP